MEVKDSRKRLYLMILLCIGLITASITFSITFSFLSAEKVVPSLQLTDDEVGLDSPYRYDSYEVECTPLDEYVWRDNNDWSYSQLTTYGSLVGPVPVKIFVRDSQIVLYNQLGFEICESLFCFKYD